MQPLPPGKVIFDQFPKITWHGNKYIRVGPDERLYIDLGAPCNDCLLQNAVGNVTFGSLNSMRLDGTDLQPFAEGVRGIFSMWLPILLSNTFDPGVSGWSTVGQLNNNGS